MGIFWSALTEAQATIIAALLTIIAAVIGVGLGAWLFGGRVKDLDSAIKASEAILLTHKGAVETTLAEIRTQMASLSETIGQVRGTIAEQQSANEDDDGAPWREAREAWEAVRDELERIAAKPDIDGRRRAKYARLDRRRYQDLIASVGDDGYLAPNRPLYEEAVGLWVKYRNGRKNPTKADLARLKEIQGQLVPRA
jgi:hypothetical protein